VARRARQSARITSTIAAIATATASTYSRTRNMPASVRSGFSTAI
jgi:hypothetical protein